MKKERENSGCVFLIDRSNYFLKSQSIRFRAQSTTGDAHHSVGAGGVLRENSHGTFQMAHIQFRCTTALQISMQKE
jgi:hypothetical protein